MKILITGTRSGIGKATEQYLAKQGHDIRGITGHKALDVSDRQAVGTYCRNLRATNWLPDAVILNAGIFPDDVGSGFSRANFDKTFAINVGGAINFIEELLPDMLTRGSGRFIGIASTAAFRPNALAISYPASKAALGLAMRGFDLHYRDRGVAFSTVYLGPITTEMYEGKKSTFVPNPEGVAIMLCKLLASKKTVVYYPFFPTMLSRVLTHFSDNTYLAIRKYLLK